MTERDLRLLYCRLRDARLKLRLAASMPQLPKRASEEIASLETAIGMRIDRLVAVLGPVMRR